MKIINTNSLPKKFLLAILILGIFTITFTTAKNSSKGRNKAPHNFNKETPANDWGNNDLHYLDRHDVSCPAGTALQGFKLHRPTSTQLQYKYQCKRNAAISSDYVYNYHTGINDVASNIKKSSMYLDRHHPKCLPGFAMQQFRLQRDGDRIQYRFRCVRVHCTSIGQLETKASIDGKGETVYLDRQHVRVVLEDQVMTGFKLKRYGSNYKYLVDYCNLSDTKKYKRQIGVTHQQTTKNDWGENNIHYLDRHDVKCPNNSYLQGFHLTRPEKTKISYEYMCKNFSGKSSGAPVDKKTISNDIDKDAKKSANYLDRHRVICNNGYALNRFRLLRDKKSKGDRKIYYDYKCINVNCKDTKSKETRETSGGNKGIVYLDRQMLMIGENEALQGFQLISRYAGGATYFKYRYYVCSPDDGTNKLKGGLKPLQNLGNEQTERNDRRRKF